MLMKSYDILTLHVHVLSFFVKTEIVQNNTQQTLEHLILRHVFAFICCLYIVNDIVF
jgi:isochorismate hydrolase